MRLTWLCLLAAAVCVCVGIAPRPAGAECGTANAVIFYIEIQDCDTHQLQEGVQVRAVKRGNEFCSDREVTNYKGKAYLCIPCYGVSCAGTYDIYVAGSIRKTMYMNCNDHWTGVIYYPPCLYEQAPGEFE